MEITQGTAICRNSLTRKLIGVKEQFIIEALATGQVSP